MKQTVSTTKIDVDNRTIIRVMAAAVAFVLFFNILDAVSEALILIAIAFFLALALHAPVTYLADRITRGSRSLATAIAYFVVLVLIGFFLYAIVPPLLRQSGNFIDNFPAYVNELKASDNIIADAINRYGLDAEIQNVTNNIGSQLSQASGVIFNGLGRVGAVIVQILTVLVLTFFMIVEGPSWMKRFWELQPADKLAQRQALASRMYQIVAGFVNGQLLIALLSALTSLIALLVVGAPYPLALAGVVGICSLIPLIGATLGASVVVLVSLFDSVYVALAMLIFFLIYQQIENNVIQPYVQSRTLDVSPLLVLVAVIIGVNLSGLLGGLVAIPVAACLRILIINYLQQRQARAAGLH